MRDRRASGPEGSPQIQGTGYRAGELESGAVLWASVTGPLLPWIATPGRNANCFLRTAFPVPVFNRPDGTGCDGGMIGISPHRS